MAGFAQDVRLSSLQTFQQQLCGRCTPPYTAVLDSAIPLLLLQSDKAMDLTCLLPLFHHSNWENPRESIGEPIGRLRNGRYQCWHVTGPALKTRLKLDRELQEYIATCPKSGTVIWGMYMVGHREDNAAPKLLICSTEKRIRKTIRKMVRKSKILDKYPGIGLGDASSLPDRGVIVQMAKEAMGTILPPDCDMRRDRAVLIEGSETAAGKRIYTVNSDGETMHAATAGPFVFINDTWCQLTVSHPFFATHPCVSNQREVPEIIEDDCEFDGMSDVDEEADLEATTTASVSSFSLHEKSSLVEDWLASPPPSQDDSYVEEDNVSEAETSDTGSDFRPSNRSNSIPTTVQDSLDGMERTSQPTPASAQQMDLNMSRLQYLGKLGMASDECEESPLDYALIVINNGRIPQLTAPQFINPQLIIAKSFPAIDLVDETSPWKDCVREIGLDTIDVVALTPRGGPVYGKLNPNPSYLRIANKSSFYRVFPLTLESTVSGGDCGSPVFDTSGRFCGHIVAGGLRTSHAYMVPASDILNDLASHIWGKISLPSQAAMRVSKPIGTPDYALALPRTTTLQNHFSGLASPLTNSGSSDLKNPIISPELDPDVSMSWKKIHTRCEDLSDERPSPMKGADGDELHSQEIEESKRHSTDRQEARVTSATPAFFKVEPGSSSPVMNSESLTGNLTRQVQDDFMKYVDDISSMSRDGDVDNVSRRPKSFKTTKTIDDWSEYSNPEERRRIQNRIAQRKFREKTRERMERDRRDAKNKQNSNLIYEVSFPNDLSADQGGTTPWSGRMIRNNFQITRSLAFAAFEPEELRFLSDDGIVTEPTGWTLNPPPHTRQDKSVRASRRNIPMSLPNIEQNAAKETTETTVSVRQIAPPPHLRKQSTTFDPRPRGSIAAALRQATLGIVNPMGLSASELLANGSSPGGLTVVLAKGELFDDLIEGGQDTAAMGSSLAKKAMGLALQVAASVADHPNETSLTRQDDKQEVRDKLRSKSRFGRWRPTKSMHSHDGMRKFAESDNAFDQDLGVSD